MNPYAGLATRTLAFAADAAIVNAVAWLVAAVVALGLSLFAVPDGVVATLAVIGAVLALLWTVAYFVFFWSSTGQTPGNRMLGIRVVAATTGRPVRGRRAAARVAALPLSALPLCAGFLMILVDRRRRALHDRLVGTVVVYDSALPALTANASIIHQAPVSAAHDGSTLRSRPPAAGPSAHRSDRRGASRR